MTNSEYEVMNRYLKCLEGGTPAVTGVPDGDGRLAITRNYRSVDTLKPDSNGVIDLYFAATPRGMVHVTRDLATATQSGVVWWSDGAGILKGNSISGVTRVLAPSIDAMTTPGAPTPPYRVVNGVFKLQFTGSSMYNGGTCAITQRALVTDTNAQEVLNGTGINGVRIRPFGARQDLSQKAITGPARKDYTAVMLPRDTEYYSTETAFTDQDLNTSVPGIVMGPTSGLTGWKAFAGWNPHPSARVYHVRYEGLDASASITIDSRYCIQMLIPNVDTNLLPFARPSEATNQSVLSQVLAKLSEVGMAAANSQLPAMLATAALSYINRGV